MKEDDPVERFTREYLAYLPVLRGLAARILRGDKDEVDEVLQDVWILGALASRRTRVEHYRTWMGSITVNAALTQLRKRRRRLEFLTDADALEEMPDRRTSPADAAAERQVLAKIETLAKKAPGMFAFLRLVRLEGLTHEEAAERFGVAVGTSKSQAHKALAQLQNTLNPPKKAA